MKNRNNTFPNTMISLINKDFIAKILFRLAYVLVSTTMIVAKIFGWLLPWWLVLIPIYWPVPFFVVMFLWFFIIEFTKKKNGAKKENM